MTMGIKTFAEKSENRSSEKEINESVENIPNSTSEAIFPMSVVPMNQVGLLTKKDSILPETFPFFP